MVAQKVWSIFRNYYLQVQNQDNSIHLYFKLVILNLKLNIKVILIIGQNLVISATVEFFERSQSWFSKKKFLLIWLDKPVTVCKII